MQTATSDSSQITVDSSMFPKKNMWRDPVWLIPTVQLKYQLFTWKLSCPNVAQIHMLVDIGPSCLQSAVLVIGYFIVSLYSCQNEWWRSCVLDLSNVPAEFDQSLRRWIKSGSQGVFLFNGRVDSFMLHLHTDVYQLSQCWMGAVDQIHGLLSPCPIYSMWPFLLCHKYTV